MKDVSVLKTRVVSSNIRKIREHKHYTQEYLAAKLGISQNAYSKIELNYSKLTLDRLFRIADILEIDVIQLLSDRMDYMQKSSATG